MLNVRENVVLFFNWADRVLQHLCQSKVLIYIIISIILDYKVFSIPPTKLLHLLFLWLFGLFFQTLHFLLKNRVLKAQKQSLDLKTTYLPFSFVAQSHNLIANILLVNLVLFIFKQGYERFLDIWTTHFFCFAVYVLMMRM